MPANSRPPSSIVLFTPPLPSLGPLFPSFCLPVTVPSPAQFLHLNYLCVTSPPPPSPFLSSCKNSLVGVHSLSQGLGRPSEALLPSYRPPASPSTCL